jgi:hypothetical protein
MHLYVIARGIKDDLERWENDILAQYVKHDVIVDGKKQEGKVRVAVRPVQLYEIVFPEKSLNRVLNIVKPSIKDYGGRYKYFYKMFAGLRKILGLSSIPEWQTENNGEFFVSNKWVGVHGIGLKKDKFDKNGIELL